MDTGGIGGIGDVDGVVTGPVRRDFEHFECRPTLTKRNNDLAIAQPLVGEWWSSRDADIEGHIGAGLNNFVRRLAGDGGRKSDRGDIQMPAANGARGVTEDVVRGVEPPDSVRVRSIKYREGTVIRCHRCARWKRVVRSVVGRLVGASEDSGGVRKRCREVVRERQADEIRRVVTTGVRHQHELLPAGSDQQHVDVIGHCVGDVGENDAHIGDEARKVGHGDGRRIRARGRSDRA